MSWFAGFFRRGRPAAAADLAQISKWIRGIRPGDRSVWIRYDLDKILIGTDPQAALDHMRWPFKLCWDNDDELGVAKVGVQGGKVWQNSGAITVDDYDHVAVSDGDMFVLTVIYNHDGSADSASISKTATPPQPISYLASADPNDGQSTHRFVLGEIDADEGIIQRVFGDIYLPKGKTWTEEIIYDVTYSPGDRTFRKKQRTIIWVNGWQYNVSAESNVVITTAQLCPEE